MTKKFIEDLDKFIDKLKNPDEFRCNCNLYQNPWNDENKCENLRKFLMKYKDAKYILIGEAPGRKGCFECGVPFCDDFTLERLGIDTQKTSKSKETSAQRIYHIFKDDFFIAWNVFPYHPCKLDKTNRHPDRDELKFGIEYLIDFLNLFYKDGKILLLMGNVAAWVFKNICDKNADYRKIKYINLIHPSPCADRIRRKTDKRLSNLKGSVLWEKYVNLEFKKNEKFLR